MRAVIETNLPCDADAAWGEVLTSRLLREVAAPLVIFRPVPGGELPDVWVQGDVMRCRSYLFGVFPLGTRTVKFERIDAASREIQTREADALVPRWDHLIRIRTAGIGRCRYRDEIEIDAGWRTVVVWLFARWFYRHRQRRWHAVARRLSGRSVCSATVGLAIRHASQKPLGRAVSSRGHPLNPRQTLNVHLATGSSAT